jgi:hypothetical protein
MMDDDIPDSGILELGNSRSGFQPTQFRYAVSFFNPTNNKMNGELKSPNSTNPIKPVTEQPWP